MSELLHSRMLKCTKHFCAFPSQVEGHGEVGRVGLALRTDSSFVVDSLAELVTSKAAKRYDCAYLLIFPLNSASC